LAVANYHETYGCFPPAYLANRDGKPMHSWRVLILPFLAQQELYRAYNFDEPWNGPNNRNLESRIGNIYVSVRDSQWGRRAGGPRWVAKPTSLASAPGNASG
jgi:Protein of unknown function (DUF1559)